MTAHISFTETDNISKGFNLDDVEIVLCERGFLSITGTDGSGTTWRMTIPVEALAAALGKAGSSHG